MVPSNPIRRLHRFDSLLHVITAVVRTGAFREHHQSRFDSRCAGSRRLWYMSGVCLQLTTSLLPTIFVAALDVLQSLRCCFRITCHGSEAQNIQRPRETLKHPRAGFGWDFHVRAVAKAVAVHVVIGRFFIPVYRRPRLYACCTRQRQMCAGGHWDHTARFDPVSICWEGVESAVSDEHLQSEVLTQDLDGALAMLRCSVSQFPYLFVPLEQVPVVFADL